MSASFSNDFEELSLNQHQATRRTTRDWSLPPDFLSLLATPPSSLINTLIPLHPPASPSAPKASPSPTAPFISALKKAPDTVTEKGAEAHASTNSPLVDLFSDFTPGIGAEKLCELLEKAWKEDSLATLKIVYQARSIHQGKGWKDGFYRAASWIWEKHPRTLLENLHLIVDPTCERPRDAVRDAKQQKQRESASAAANNGVLDLDDEGNIDVGQGPEDQYPPRPHGSFKDLTDLLILHLSGQLATSYKGKFTALDESLAPSWQAATFKASRVALRKDPNSKRVRSGFKAVLKSVKKKEKEGGVETFDLKVWRAPNLKAKHNLLHGRSEQALCNDKKYQALYITILHLFVKNLEDDLRLLAKHQDFLKLSPASRGPFKGQTSPHLFGISYAAKWVPSPAKSGDKITHFSTALAHMLYPGDGVQWSREKLQKLVLTPLRKALAIPEVEMSNRSWKIDYTKVPSKSMARNSTAFAEHDQEGFERYLTRVSNGRATISGAALMPHEILFEATQGKTVIHKRLADLQWKTLVQSIRNSSSNRLSNCIAIADVSGSMGSFSFINKKDPAPILPCIALTLLMGDLAVAPWNGAFFTFSADPKFETIEVSLPLSERANSLSRAHWEMSTNFYKVFDLILNTAKAQKLKPNDMVKKVFVFSDMQFDAAADRKICETEHTVIQRKFEDAGYQMPHLVYWNLASREDGAPKPAQADIEGVSLVSGFSGTLMKYYLGQADDIDEGMVESEIDEVEEPDENDMILVEERCKSKSTPAGTKTERKEDNALQTVMKVISHESFSKLKVID
ncbi:uncharacterized protein IL334_006227 [Kwoniella shivajii]|uniref:TROVE domain-containing protein n=1 Tax=Kwoniella shivajii TaxID=564305 RepID=A0ABZ1D5P4_9TREE|nr:hypothetical protein IL334_006227 [Kwoniella shivajii]